MSKKKTNKYDPDNQIGHDLKTDQNLLAAGVIAGSVNAAAVSQLTAEEIAANERNIAEREIIERDMEEYESEVTRLEKEADEHLRLIKPENEPTDIYKLIAYVAGMVIFGGAILVNGVSYALREVDNTWMAWAFALSVLGIAAGKELAVQSCSDTVKDKAHAISKIGLLVSSMTYVWAFIQKFGMEEALDPVSLLAPTDDRLLLGSQICSEVFIFSLLAAGLAKLFHQRKLPMINSRRVYYDDLINVMAGEWEQLSNRRLELEETICTFEVKRKRYEAFCKSVETTNR